ncbi:hypothetical protein C480_19899 [Natrialba aegyptia DSM 13077]|uniref:Uncharacterized protein n=1 Tax=Natrialba aegyptia DSM 13077 TaxID=1227491 RepID=M0AM18_9EURY|nr:hypothetical protein C480_19899 [Natrialba aegyptia DSM 13077]
MPIAARAVRILCLLFNLKAGTTVITVDKLIIIVIRIHTLIPNRFLNIHLTTGQFIVYKFLDFFKL